MKTNERKSLTSKQLLAKIGLDEHGDVPMSDLLDEAPEDFAGDLAPALRERYRQLKEVRHNFRPGMVIGWKPGLKNRRWPRASKPAIVVELLATPVFDTDEAGSTYFREPLDMIIGIFVDEGEHRGDFLVFHANSQRYQPWPGEEV